MFRHNHLSVFLLVITVLAATPAFAEFEVKAYGGGNTNFDAKVKTHQGAVSDSRTVGWDGKFSKMPPYWGARGTYWFENARWKNWGVAIDYTHEKAYADVNFGADPVFDHLEFTDGNNVITADVLYRWQRTGSSWTPYAGAGIGVTIPHTEVTLDAAAPARTFKYDCCNFAAAALAGINYNIGQHWGAFTEGKITYTDINSDLSGGGNVKVQLWSPQVALGLFYIF